MKMITDLAQEFESFIEDKQNRQNLFYSLRKRRHQKGLKLSKKFQTDNKGIQVEIAQSLVHSQDLSQRKIEQDFMLINSLNLNEQNAFKALHQQLKSQEKCLLKRQAQNEFTQNSVNEKIENTNSQEIEQQARKRQQLYYQQLEAQDQSATFMMRGVSLFRNNHIGNQFQEDDVVFERSFKFDFGMQFKEIEKLPETIHIEKNQNKKTQCQICLENIQQGQKQTYLFCFHGFHSNCIRHWLINNASCPLCKMNIKEQMKKFQKLNQKSHK